MLRQNKLMNKEFYSILAEELLAYVDDDETNTHSSDVPTTWTIYKALAVTGAFGKIYPACEICSME